MCLFFLLTSEHDYAPDTSSGISYQLRNVNSILCRCDWDVATCKWKVHNVKIEISSFFVTFSFLTDPHFQLRGVGQGVKQTQMYLWYPLFQVQLDRCDIILFLYFVIVYGFLVKRYVGAFICLFTIVRSLEISISKNLFIYGGMFNRSTIDIFESSCYGFYTTEKNVCSYYDMCPSLISVCRHSFRTFIFVLVLPN